MEEKKSHTKNERSLPDHEEQELWFSALVADDSCAYNVDKAFDRFVSRTQQKRRTVFNIPKIVYGAAAVILLLIASTISYWWGERQLQNQFADILVEAPLGAKTKLILPDSTLVWLNAGSKIVYSQGFGVKDRHLRLNGEAYFEVAHNEKSPFVVRTHAMDVEVLGTKFNVEAYSAGRTFEASLMQGKVRVKSPANEKLAVVLLPHYKTTLKDGKLVVSKIDDYNVYRWKEGLYCFKNKPFARIMEDLERYYDLEIQLDKKSIEGVALTGKFRISDGLDYALRVLQKDVAFTYRRDKDNDVIYIK